MSGNNEVEASRFARSVGEIEKLIRSGGDNRSGYPLAAALEAKQARLDSIRGEGDQVTSEKKEKEQKDRSAIAQMVELEAKLNKEEKEKYSQFLSKEYFTKSEFKDLDQFYSHSWYKLSEEGKAEMDKRVHEGVRQGQYEIEELPDSVKQRVGGGSDQTIQKSSKESASGSYQKESSKLEDSVPDVVKPGRDTISSQIATKANLTGELAGLANLSPVREIDSVVVPQIEKCGECQIRGG